MSSLTSNPFATRFVSPGRVSWVGPDHDLKQLALRWNSLNGRAAILGVHGSGKSTLLEHLVPRIGDVIWRRDAQGLVTTKTEAKEGNRPTVWLQLRKTVPKSMSIPWEELRRDWLLIVDGFEQLSLWRRAKLLAMTRLRGIKLLVTSHRSTMLPTLCELSMTASTAKQIVMQLTAGQGEFSTLSEEVLEQSLQNHRGNMREILMEFYDRFEDYRAFGTSEVNPKS